MEEAGVLGFEITNWFGVYVPSRTPKVIISKLNTEILKRGCPNAIFQRLLKLDQTHFLMVLP